MKQNVLFQHFYIKLGKRTMRTVLVVDDEPLVLDVTASILKDFGCEVETATSGAEALAKLKANEAIGLLITDINMPGVSGYELAARAKQNRAGVKIILLSGAETEARGLPFIRKPVRDHDLARVMKQIGGMC
jgi:two-component system, cell cycle response regulator CpdR